MTIQMMLFPVCMRTVAALTLSYMTRLVRRALT